MGKTAPLARITGDGSVFVSTDKPTRAQAEALRLMASVPTVYTSKKTAHGQVAGSVMKALVARGWAERAMPSTSYRLTEAGRAVLAKETASVPRGHVAKARPCRQCHEDTTHADGFCSDTCEKEYDRQLAGEPPCEG